jgi:hypothetical protein
MLLSLSDTTNSMRHYNVLCKQYVFVAALQSAINTEVHVWIYGY